MTPRRVEPDETVENPQTFGRRYARPVIGNDDLRVTIDRTTFETNLATRVSDCVVDEVAPRSHGVVLDHQDPLHDRG
jgi:hypothetical protein